MSHQPASAEPRWAKPLDVGVLAATFLAIAWASVGLDGFRFGLGNHGLQVPILQRAVDPALFPGDPFMATLDRYTSAVWWILAQVGRAYGIRDWEPVLFALQLATRVLLVAALYALVRPYVRDRRFLIVAIAILALGSALRGPSVVGIHGLIGGRVFDHTGFANAFSLFALAAALRGKHVAAAGLAAAAFDINAFVGVWLAPVVLATLLASPGGGGSRRTWLAAAAVYAVVAAPVAAWVLSAVTAPNPPGFQPFDYRGFLYEYFPKHFFIDSADPRDLLELGTIVVAALVALVGLAGAGRGLRACYGSWLVLFALGAAAPYVTGNPTILNLHLLRMDGFLMMLAAVAVTVCAGTIVERRHASPEALAAGVGILAGLATGYWWLTLAATVVATIMLREPAPIYRWLLLSMLLLAAASLWQLIDRSPTSKAFVFASTLALLGVFAATGSSLAPAFALIPVLSWARQAAAATLSLLAILALSAPALPPAGRRVVAHALLGAAALLALARTSATDARLLLAVVIGTLLLEPVLSRTRAGRAAAARARTTVGYAGLVALVALATVIDLRRPGPKDPIAADVKAWRDVQMWARANTRIDDVFAVPDWPDAFGVWAERSIWVDWKHGAAVMWAPAYYHVYRERRRVQAETGDAARFARTTGVCFAVVDATAPATTLGGVDLLRAGLPVLYSNGRFAVVGLCGSRAP